MTFREAYVAKQPAEDAWEGEEKPFGGSAQFGAALDKSNEQLRGRKQQKTAGKTLLTNQMMDLLEVYLDNIAAAATQTATNGGPIAELPASLAISVDIFAR